MAPSPVARRRPLAEFAQMITPAGLPRSFVGPQVTLDDEPAMIEEFNRPFVHRTVVVTSLVSDVTLTWSRPRALRIIEAGGCFSSRKVTEVSEREGRPSHGRPLRRIEAPRAGLRHVGRGAVEGGAPR